MRKRLWILACVVAVSGAMVGCGDEPMADPDAGPTSDLPVATVTEGAPDWSCIGTETAPTAGAATPITVTFTGPLSPMLPEGTMVDFFPGNVVTEGCTAPACVSAATATNAAMVTLPADGWFAYRIPMTSSTFPTVGYFRPATTAASGTVIGTTIVNLIPGIFGRMRLPGTTVMSGAATDCMGRPIGGVEARVFVDGVRVVEGPGMTDPFVGYIEGGAMNAGTPYTADDAAQFAVANIPPGATRLELWAVQAEGEAPTRIACEEVQTFADTVIVASPAGLRSDYPAGSGCL